jgi:cytochrome c oxidase subunit 2
VLLAIAAEQETFPVLSPASPQTQAIHDLFIWVMAIAAVIFAVMGTLIVTAILRFRARSRATPAQDHGSERREIMWMIGPVLVVLWLGAISAKLVLAINAAPRADPPGEGDADLIVTGRQWWWEVRYVDTGVVSANEIHIPTGRKMRVRLESGDVIHCFWVPQLARKIDVIPGWTNHLWLEADQPGEYQGYCAEYCGTQHAWMKFKVYAHGALEYDAWTKRQLVASPLPRDALSQGGEKLFRSFSCIDCHSRAGIESSAQIGPDLTHVALRATLAGGALKNSPENLGLWLRNPQAIKPGCKMPDFKLNEEHIAQLVAFLEAEP